MKKTLLTIALFAFLLSLTACSPETPEKGAAPSSSVSDDALKKSHDEEATPEELNFDAVYGKISDIAGNALALSLAKDPYADLAPEGDEGTTIAAAVVPATGITAIDGGEAPKMQLDYTGESKDYTVPAGVKITGKNGGEAQLDALKKGSVLMLLTENDRITEIVILE